MKHKTHNQPDAEAMPAPGKHPGGDSILPVSENRLLSFREVNEKIGSACKSSHTARNLARRGLIKGVRWNSRVVRFTAESVENFILGRHSA